MSKYLSSTGIIIENIIYVVARICSKCGYKSLTLNELHKQEGYFSAPSSHCFMITYVVIYKNSCQKCVIFD